MISYATKNTLKILGLIFSHLFKIKRLFPGVKSEKSTSLLSPADMGGVTVFFFLSGLVIYGVEMLIPALLNSLNPFLEKKIRFEFIQINY